MGANNSSSKEKGQDVPEIGIHRHSIDSVSAGDTRDISAPSFQVRSPRLARFLPSFAQNHDTI